MGKVICVGNQKGGVGKAAQDTAVGFSDEVVRQIREYMQRQAVSAEQTRLPADSRPPLENWQKSYENGEYLHSAEMAEEQNYSMIDGRMNNPAAQSFLQRECSIISKRRR